MTTRFAWLDPQLPAHAADLSDRSKARMIARARLDLLHRTFTGTFVYPVFTLVIGGMVGLTAEYPVAVVSIAAVFALVVVARLFLYRRAVADVSAPSWAGRAHLLLGILSAAALAFAIGAGFVVREGDSAATAGYLAMAGIAGSVVMIASTHRTLAWVWVLASIGPGMLVFALQGGTTAHLLFVMYLIYL
ncbi:MAG TPA: hypothetical protein VFG69_02895, partial [Nannocystaceae bacterium]|nr:hypothetical protein [Nannocystaceae bacterium]